MPGNCMLMYDENSEPGPLKYFCFENKNGLDWYILKKKIQII